MGVHILPNKCGDAICYRSFSTQFTANSFTPPFPAYPSGHGFQSRLAALVLSELRPDARGPLLAMAQRIGFNREVAGVHYPSDTRAGQSLAEQVFEIARQGKHFQELVAEAKAEWR